MPPPRAEGNAETQADNDHLETSASCAEIDFEEMRPLAQN